MASETLSIEERDEEGSSVMPLEDRHMTMVSMERVKGIEPSYEAWEAAVLPLNYTRISGGLYRQS